MADDTLNDREGGIDDSAVLDLGTLDRLAADLGGDEGLIIIVSTFLEELPGRVESVEAWALGGGDRDGAERAAHSLASTSELLGAVRLGPLCRDIEGALRRGDSAGSVRTGALREESAAASRALAAALEGRGDP